MTKKKVSVFWFRRDLRIDDNRALYEALKSDYPVLPIFIFDTNILDELKQDDARVSFIYEQISGVNEALKAQGSGLYCEKGTPQTVWESILEEFDVQSVFLNRDYEPYAQERDEEISKILIKLGINYHAFKDQVIFEQDEVLKADKTPYTVYTPYKNKWLEKFEENLLINYDSQSISNYFPCKQILPSLEDVGFKPSSIKVLDYNLKDLHDYEAVRDIPALNETSHLSPHLRFGTVSIRQVLKEVLDNSTFVSELIWREFFMQILYHFPKVVHSNFKTKYDSVKWRNNKVEFEQWKKGKTGYPIVDAGMRELNTTGYMHNRVRMITAGFLCKHLLIDWRWGEAYFAEKLLDYELSANNGNWQWAAGTGCDATPYFRIFNPITQLKKFDKDLVYVRKWVHDFDTLHYPLPMVDHKEARERALKVYKKGIEAVLGICD